MAVDVKSSGWYGSVKMAGAKQPVIFEGSIAMIMNQLLRHLQETSLRRDSAGNRTITITIQDNEFGREANHGLDADFLAHFDMSGVAQATEDDPAFQTPPWAEDPDWVRFQRFMSNDHNYGMALPGEVNQLLTRLKANWGGSVWRNPITDAQIAIDDRLKDRRAR